MEKGKEGEAGGKGKIGKVFLVCLKRKRKGDGKEEKNHFSSDSFHFWRDLAINEVKGTNPFKFFRSKFLPSNLLSKQWKM